MNGRIAALLLAAVVLSACREAEHAEADGRLVWDREGRAYFVQPDLGNHSIVTPVPDANRPPCPLGYECLRKKQSQK